MIHLPVRDNALRPCLLLLFALLLACMSASVSARSDDRNQRLTADADRNDCIIEDDAPCVLTGNVRIRQGSLDIRAARADLRLAEGEVRTVKLTGKPVKMTQKTDNGSTINASANQADYDLASEVLVLTEKATVQQPGRGSIAGEHIIYNTRTHQVQGGGEGGGRVRLQFEPQNKTDDGDNKGKPR